jgi:arylsulfatase
VDTNLGWKGPEMYVAPAPQIYDLLADPQERYDIFMTTFVEKTWAMPIFSMATQDLMKSFAKYPPRKMQGETYQTPFTIQQYRKIHEIEALLKRKGIDLTPDKK